MKNLKKIILFDLDKTLITHDTFKLFFFYLIKEKFFFYFFNLFVLIKLILKHILSNCEHKTKTKSNLIAKILAPYTKKKILILSKKFAIYIYNNFKNKKIYDILLKEKRKHSEIYIVTASIGLYCRFLADLFGANLICTKVILNKKYLAKIIGKNCYGYQKRVRVLREIKNFRKMDSVFYTDSISDRPLLNLCNKGFIIGK